MDGFHPADRGDRSDDFDVSIHLNIYSVFFLFVKIVFSFGDRFAGEMERDSCVFDIEEEKVCMKFFFRFY